MHQVLPLLEFKGFLMLLVQSLFQIFHLFVPYMLFCLDPPKMDAASFLYATSRKNISALNSLALFGSVSFL